jgi:hypothetical protein
MRPLMLALDEFSNLRRIGWHHSAGNFCKLSLDEELVSFNHLDNDTSISDVTLYNYF